MAYADIDRQLQSLLGRAATADERAYYDKFIRDEGVTPYEIGLMLQGQPEYQGQQLNRDLSAFQGALTAQDNAYLRNAADIAGSQAQSRFAGLGRPNTSALGASVFGATGQAAQNLAMQRQSALANFYGSGLRQNAALAQSYGQGAIDRGYGLRDERRHRAYEIEDYYRMKNDYQDEKNASTGWRGVGSFDVASGLARGALSLGANALGGYMAGRGLRGAGLFSK